MYPLWSVSKVAKHLSTKSEAFFKDIYNRFYSFQKKKKKEKKKKKGKKKINPGASHFLDMVQKEPAESNVTSNLIKVLSEKRTRICLQRQ